MKSMLWHKVNIGLSSTSNWIFSALPFCNTVAPKYFYLCIVKVVAIILSFYFLALNVVPCSDAANSADDTQVVTVIDIDGDHDQDCELCSPFCQCHCCHVHTINFGLAAFETLQPAIPQEFFVHFDDLGKDIPHSILQPPQA